MFRNRVFLIVLIVIALAAGGGYYYYNNVYVQPNEAVEKTIQTTRVRRGDLTISASGSGELISADDVSLGFRTGGALSEVLVDVGDWVEAGTVLARLDDTETRRAVANAELKVAQAKAAVASLTEPEAARLALVLAEIPVTQAEASLESLQDPAAVQRTIALAEIQVAQAEATLASQQDPDAAQRAIALADIQVAQAEVSLASAQLRLDDLLEWTADAGAVAIAQANLDAAQASHEAANSQSTSDQTASARISLEQAQSELGDAQGAYSDAWDPARDWELYTRGSRLESERDSAIRNLERAQQSLEIAQANYNLAWANIDDTGKLNAQTQVLNAQIALEDAQTGPTDSEVEEARLAVRQADLSLAQARINLEEAKQPVNTTQAELSLAQAQINLEDTKQLVDTIQAELSLAQARVKLEEAKLPLDTAQSELSLVQAQLDLEAAEWTLSLLTLVAPIDGVVTAVSAQVGETVGTGSFIVLSNLDQSLVEIYLDETDLDSIAVGNEVEVVFDALPDATFSGHVVRVEPELVTVENVPTVQAVAVLEGVGLENLPAGLNASVDVIGGKAENALLVTVEALRELAPGQYAVFVVDESGELELRPVEVGLMDFANAEIISGLAQGDEVSTGIVETN